MMEPPSADGPPRAAAGTSSGQARRRSWAPAQHPPPGAPASTPFQHPRTAASQVCTLRSCHPAQCQAVGWHTSQMLDRAPEACQRLYASWGSLLLRMPGVLQTWAWVRQRRAGVRRLIWRSCACMCAQVSKSRRAEARAMRTRRAPLPPAKSSGGATTRTRRPQTPACGLRGPPRATSALLSSCPAPSVWLALAHDSRIAPPAAQADALMRSSSDVTAGV